METEGAIQFIFCIAREIKRSFESPVIFFTMKDYANCVLNQLLEMRTALLQKAKPERVFEIINICHLEWLEAVQDIENFRKRNNDTPRETILNAIDYTIERTRQRRAFLKKYNVNYINIMTPLEKKSLRTELGIIRDMEDIVVFALNEKKKCLGATADRVEFYKIVSDEIVELLNWLDRLNDYSAIFFCKVVDLKIPNLALNLTKTLRQKIDEVTATSIPVTEKVIHELGIRSKRFCSIAGEINTLSDVKTRNLIDKIQKLGKRIEQLKLQNSSAVMALQHKTMYLEDRFQSLENLKLSVNLLQNKEEIHRAESENELVEEEIRIFNHLLPHQHRYRLVEDIIKLWERAIIGEHTSIISILSATDIKEVFFDELGKFSIDKYGRKIYKVSHEDGLYQVNENNELVLVMDDDKHVYFYDECGRYYLNSDRMRVYKAHERANEYMLHRGIMLKLNEVDENVEYESDHLGRYYINESRTRIYRDKNSLKYISDGLGNLVRLRSEDDLVYNYNCAPDPIETQSSLYLKEQVGDALKTVLTRTILEQPSDPIKYLADGLERYYYNKLAKQSRLLEQNQVLAETELQCDSPKTTPFPSSVQDEDRTTIDLNFITYQFQS